MDDFSYHEAAIKLNADFRSDHDFIKLSEMLRLSHSDRRLNGCGEAIQEIVVCLNSSSSRKSFSIDRIRPCGSYEKGTALGYIGGEEAWFDIDLVVFINCNSYEDYVSSRSQYVQEMRDIVERHLTTIQIVHENSWGLTFKYRKWSFDLLPAFNAYRGVTQSVENQTAALVQIIHNNDKKKPYEMAHELGTSLAENAVKFVRDQPALTRSLIILAKYWYKKKLGGLKFYGCSTAIECIAMHAARIHENTFFSNQELLRRMFRQFLKLLSNIHIAEIVFPYPPGFTARKYIERERTPYILNPTNPYNNHARSMKKHMDKIARAADDALKIFDGKFEAPQFQHNDNSRLRDTCCCAVVVGLTIIVFFTLVFQMNINNKK